MKWSTAICLCCTSASLLACSHETPVRTAPAAPPAPPPTAISRLEEAPVKESQPTQSGIPTTAPPVAPPVAPPPAVPPDQVSMTPASGTGSARMAALVPAAAARDDKADGAQDQESIREIRALVAADPTVASTASQLVIVARSGRVWLRGQVNTAAQRAAIEKAARQAAGVVNVKNELVVLE
ncbi:MAG: BON domain-containing protein [Myxococcales bacterium]